MSALISVVIPAHNEARVVGRNLVRLLQGVDPGVLDVVVVCNGCTDDTASVARAVPGVRVVEMATPSKAEAMRIGNRASTVFPRVHLDADVQLSGTDLLALVRPILEDDVLATAPRRHLPRDRSSRPVRWYYDVWEQLPQVRTGLFGRGAIALSAEAHDRVFSLPEAMSDDLVISEAFEADEVQVVDEAVVTVVPPPSLRDLVRRRTRVATGNVQAASLGLRRAESVTSPRTILRIGARSPRLAVRVPVFVTVALLARLSARSAVRSGDFTTWLRDEGSRA